MYAIYVSMQVLVCLYLYVRFNVCMYVCSRIHACIHAVYACILYNCLSMILETIL
jgi:hypothetical protein